jgi:hypothetical protein
VFRDAFWSRVDCFGDIEGGENGPIFGDSFLSFFFVVGQRHLREVGWPGWGSDVRRVRRRGLRIWGKKMAGWLVWCDWTQSIGGDVQIIFTPEMKDSSNGNEVLSLEFGQDEL